MLQQSVRELQELYDSRPSREEDLERLAALEAELREKEAAFKKMYEEMQFYKLELVNRENNYNKVFGSTPNVGVLNPNAKRSSAVSGGTMRVVNPQGSQNGLGLLGGGSGIGPGVGAGPVQNPPNGACSNGYGCSEGGNNLLKKRVSNSVKRPSSGNNIKNGGINRAVTMDT